MTRKSAGICQPHYLPWIGYFEMIDRVDVFVFHDDVQYIKQEWKNRNRIRKTRYGRETKWLTVPVISQGTSSSEIENIQCLDKKNWLLKHLNALKDVYGKAPYFAEVNALLEEALKNAASDLAGLNSLLVESICEYLGIKTRIVRASSLNVQGQKTEKLVQICRALGADWYVANNASSAYLDADLFRDNRVGFEYQDYKHPEYEQRSGIKILEFVSHLSIVDLLYNQGSESLETIRAGRPTKATV